MNKKFVMLGVVLVVIICVLCAGVYTLTSPNTSPSLDVVTVIDATGAEVTVPYPVNRIVCLSAVETVYALGAGDKIVAITGMLTTDIKEVLPSHILDLPIVGDTDSAPNIEKIIELSPDLILASERLSDENRKMFENAGIAVIEDSSTGNRRNQYITNLGLILNAEQRAADILSYEAYYWNLVTERVANLPRNEKPLVYFEWYTEWFSTGPDGSYAKLIEAAGGINLGENATVTNPQLNAELIIEQSPDIVIRMLDYTSGETLDAFQKLPNQVLSRPGLSNLKAVKNNQVYVIKSTLLVDRDLVGLLYFAKWFNPDLFVDMDPEAVHAEMVEKYFGTTISGVYLYP